MNTILLSVAIWLIGGFSALALSRSPLRATRVGMWTAVTGCLAGFWPALSALLSGRTECRRFPWHVPGGEFHVQLDPLSAFFLVPVFALSALAAVYGGSYMLAHRARRSLGAHWFFFCTFLAGMVLVLVAHHALLFMLAWEVMSLSAFFLVTFEHEKDDVRTAGWLYLIAAHVGAAFLLALFLLLGSHAHSLDFDQFTTATPLAPAGAGLVFLLAVVGFGTKAGFVPFHIWLPEAHPAAPSHVSALMSGVMIKVGIYGVLRTLILLNQTPAPWWGPVLVLIGFAGAVLGVLLALFQGDIKRSLAYSSIENIGLITLALGVGLWGLATQHPWIAILGLAGALLHVWNHSLMKGLLFLCAGSILHGAGSRNIEQLGGLMKRMPRTGLPMTIGALALCALPPLNGFVSEWLIYLGLLNGGLAFSGVSRIVLLMLVGVLALVGGLAMICFVRLIGMTLLGEGRRTPAREAHESPAQMTLPLAILAALCVLAALAPLALVSTFAPVAERVLAIPAADFVAALHSPQSPLHTLVRMNLTIWLALGATASLLAFTLRRSPVAPDSTWGCGYAAPTPRMQYTGHSFSELLVSRLFPASLSPKTVVIPTKGIFPQVGNLTTSYPDTLNRIFYRPFFDWLVERITRLHWMQMGKIHYYMMYFVVALLAAFAWLVIRLRVIHE